MWGASLLRRRVIRQLNDSERRDGFSEGGREE